MFAVANIAWLRVLERAKRATRVEEGGDDKVKAIKDWANKCVGPTLMYTAMNLRPLLSPHAYVPPPPPSSGLSSSSHIKKPREEKDVAPPSAGYIALGYFNVMLPGDLPRSIASAPRSRQEAQAHHVEFWSRARSTKKQTSEAVHSPHLLSRNVLMGVERGVRSVKFAMEDDGYVPRPAGIAGPTPTPKPAVVAVTTKTVAPVAQKPPPAAALLGFSLLGSIDGLYHYESYPSITPTLLRCGTRKAYGGILLFCYTFRGALYVSIGWDEKAFPEFEVEGEGGVGIRAFYQELRRGVGEFLLGENDLGVDVSGTWRLPEWAEDVSAIKPSHAPTPPLKQQVGRGGRPLVAEMAKL